MNPASTVEHEFLDFSVRKLDQLCSRIEACLAQLTPEQLWWRPNEETNAVGNLALHLDGNIRQWILTGIAAEPDTRNRQAEFDARAGIPAADLASQLRSTVDRALAVFRTLPAPRLTERITIQGFNVTVLEAIYHVVEHFAGHAFQIFHVTKSFTSAPLDFYSYLQAPGGTAHKTP